MLSAYEAPTIRAAEEATGEALTSGELMRRASSALAQVVEQRLTQRGGSQVVGLIGPGNNGGDALHALALLANSSRTITALAHGEVHEGGLAAALQAGIPVVQIPAAELPEAVLPVLAQATVTLDGVLGIGGRPGLPDWACACLDALNPDAYLIAVDVASGQPLSGDGLVAEAVFADETVTFAAPKPLHLLPPTSASTGRLTVVDIGLDLPDPVISRLESADASALWPVPGVLDDKYSRGVLGVIAGSERYPGAAVLATAAAVHAGVGMVRYLGPLTPTRLVHEAVPEAVPGTGQCQAWVIGPGLDVTAAEDHLAVARQLLRGTGDLPVVLDAGGLELLDEHGIGLPPGSIITPHSGEAARLLTQLTGTSVQRAQVMAAPLEHARELARLVAATVLLKGNTTLVVPSEDGPVWSQCDAPTWTATAGAGDVLAGLLGMLLAAGLAAPQAGALAALVHGQAADRGNPGGPIRARAIAEALGPTIAELLGHGSRR